MEGGAPRTAVQLDDRIATWNATDAPYPHDRRIQQLFEEQAARTPDALAIVCGDERLSYARLNRQANRLAHHLQRCGAGAEALVGLYMECSPAAIVGLLAILKAGGAYLPLDPTYPPARVAYMIKDAAPVALLTRAGLAESLPESGGHQDCRVVIMDGPDAAAIAGESVENPVTTTTAEDAAYVIYTSGSTGRPKGVVALHRGAVNRCYWMWRTYPFAAGEVGGQKTALSFVDSVWEIFGFLLQGVPLAIIPDAVLTDTYRLVEALADAGVTRLVLVPSLLRLLLRTFPDLRERVPRLTFWVSSGEALPATLCRQFRGAMPGCTLLNLYGSSEVAADATCYDTRDWNGAASAPIGRPIANTRVYLLGDDRRPVPVGTIGDIYVGGAGLARGYLNRPDLTAERFIPDPFSADPAARLYDTGDLGSWRPDGAIEYRGRADDQVKIRGYRIELGDIEAAVAAHPDVRESVVVARDDGLDEPRLVAYVVPHNAVSVGAPAAGLRAFLAERLPAYMVPSAVVPLEALPLTPNGKVDRRTLPAPDAAAMRAGPFAPPADSTEERLAELWQDLLRVRPIGVTDNFFDLGAHSLLAVRLVTEVERVFGRRVALATLFEEPTIRRLAAALQEGDGDPTGLVTVQHGAPGRRPLYFVHGDFWAGGFYTLNLARRIGADQPFYTFEQHGLHDDDVPATVEEMAAHHVRTLRARQPPGPYLLGGHCSAGLIAFEMARRLEAQGQRVALLALVHTAVESAHFVAARRLMAPLGRLARLDHATTTTLAERLGGYLLRLDRMARLDRDGKMDSARRAARRLLRKPTTPRATGVTLAAPEQRDALEQGLQARRQRANAAYIRANRRYVPRAYGGPVALFVASDETKDYGRDRTMGWGPVIKGALDIQHIPGDHVTCVTDNAHTRTVARLLRARLDRVQADQTG